MASDSVRACSSRELACASRRASCARASVLARLQPRGGDLVGHVLQVVGPAAHFLEAGAQPRLLGAECRQRLVRGGNGFPLRTGLRVGVENVTLGFGLEEGNRLVLAVEVDQSCTERGQHPDGGGTPVDPAGADRPSALTSRRITRRPSSTSTPSASTRRVSARDNPSNAPSTTARPAPGRTTPLSPRPPRRRPRASTRIDLPAPVSPVRTLRPGPSGRVTSAIVATSRTRSSASI